MMKMGVSTNAHDLKKTQHLHDPAVQPKHTAQLDNYDP